MMLLYSVTLNELYNLPSTIPLLQSSRLLCILFQRVIQLPGCGYDEYVCYSYSYNVYSYCLYVPAGNLDLFHIFCCFKFVAPHLHNSASSFISLNYNQDTFPNGSDTAEGTETGRKQPLTQPSIICYGSGQNPGLQSKRMVAIRRGRLGKLGSHLLMSPDFRGTCVAESPARATVRAGSARVEGRIKPTSLWAPQWHQSPTDREKVGSSQVCVVCSCCTVSSWHGQLKGQDTDKCLLTHFCVPATPLLAGSRQ